MAALCICQLTVALLFANHDDDGDDGVNDDDVGDINVRMKIMLVSDDNDREYWSLMIMTMKIIFFW